MNTVQALQAIFKGKKVRRQDWENKYLIMKDNSIFISDDIDCIEYNFVKFKKDEVWEEFEGDQNLFLSLKVGDKFYYFESCSDDESFECAEKYTVAYIDNNSIYCKSSNDQPFFMMKNDIDKHLYHIAKSQ